MFMPMGFDKQDKEAKGGGGFLDNVLGGIGGLFTGGGQQKGGGGFGGIGSAIGGLFGPLGSAVGGAFGGLFGGGGGAKSQDKWMPPTGLIDWGGKGDGGLDVPGPWSPGPYDDPGMQYFSSDERLKTDIRPIQNALDLIAKL
jgi:Chaperone of endosialidase